MNLTQRELAALLEVSHRTVENWEAGLNQPTGERARRYATMLADFQRRIERAARIGS